MNFGEKLKLLRQEKGWNQPELAEQMGIEQSYLSKLENGKSIPSADVFDRILEIFALTVEDMLRGLDPKIIRKQLITLPQVAGHLSEFQSKMSSTKKWWILSSAAAVVCGFTALFSAVIMLGSPSQSYEYSSQEIVPRGPNGEVFTSLNEFIEFTVAPIGQQLLSTELSDRDRWRQLDRERENVIFQYSNLKFTDFFTSENRLGQFFSQELTSAKDWDILVPSGISNGATRTYTLTTVTEVQSSFWGIFVILGVFLLVAGIFGFITERMVLRPDTAKAAYA